MFRIIKRKEMAEGRMISNEIDAPLIARKAQPGQFVILKANETGERIPLTIADYNPIEGTITVIYAVVGRSTSLFSELQEGDFYQDVVGPLGQPTRLERVGTAICVGGGTALAVLYPIARALKQKGNRVITIVGSRNRDSLILEEEMMAVSDEFLVCTDDGSYGRPALVTEILEEVLARSDADLVVAIGPVGMMKRASDITRPLAIKTVVSLNPIMIDGTGMCGGCRVVVDGETRFACVDGPEFDGHRVDFEHLTKRLQAFKIEERQSLETHKLPEPAKSQEIHRCKMEALVSEEGR